MINKYIKKLVDLEKNRQETTINLIASENYAKFNNSNIETFILSDKYAEGYPKKRYYAGCKYVDMIEEQAIKYCKSLFNAKYVNVQTHSGSQANQAVYMALCKINDKILGLDLKHGGHLTHGCSVNYSGYFYNSIKYNLNENNYFNYDEIEELIKNHQPKLLIVGASAYSRIINWKILGKISLNYNVNLLADISHTAGLIASKVYPSPIKISDVVTFTLHKTLRGPRSAVILTNKKKLINIINKAVFPGLQGGPFMHVIADKALCFKNARLKNFEIYQKQVIKNSKVLSKYLRLNNFNIVSNGTDSHLFLIDLKNIKMTGIEAEKKLEKANIIVNKNTIPNDVMSSNVCSGIRLGTPAITTRGFTENEVYILSEWITDVLINKFSPLKLRKDVIKLCKKFPIY